METKKPYRDSDLSLESLSNMVSISSRYISHVINEKFNQNFFDFVNTFRIEEIKHILIHSKTHYNILNIAFNCGFNSKSTFNQAFKKHVQMTPSQYRKKFKNFKKQ